MIAANLERFEAADGKIIPLGMGIIESAQRRLLSAEQRALAFVRAQYVANRSLLIRAQDTLESVCQKQALHPPVDALLRRSGQALEITETRGFEQQAPQGSSNRLEFPRIRVEERKKADLLPAFAKLLRHL